MKRMYDDVI